MPADRPTDQVILQRVRNRIIESLDLMSSFERQRRYQADVPIADVPVEVICSWEDQVDRDSVEQFGPPVFSNEEVEAMKAFHASWEAITNRMPKPLPPIEQTQRLTEWKRLRDAAAETLSVFAKRGMLAEDQAIPTTKTR